ncbi:anti-sigma regulatory factor [Actinoplanes cyaneus]|uniref:Anti-sigma regulatory factor n=1 Tax=Actinoplanes cyaneus TaxID=52696 RepID=A0A919IHF7_9ACTN|nr:sensor histidine kinase [Actinoplanes cyaneus]MCW2140238.1 Anti-sigma regulatory factor (Ser/Thr protein kinase) [Actinoplanes cyaneus]GID65553.1 anti-sigma regulatory factor [Actinoplanes cyaneus]
MTDHPALLYRDLDEYLSGTTAFVRAAVAAGEPVLAAVPDKNLAALRDALADLGDAVRYVDLTVAGRNPGRILPGVLLPFAAAHPGRRVAVIQEALWPGRGPLEQTACMQHDALVSSVLTGAVLCPFDTGALPATWVRDAYRTHPVLITDGEARANELYSASVRFDVPLPPVPETAATLAFATVDDLAAVRGFTGRVAGRAGLPEFGVEDLVVAINELAENTILHSPAGGVVAIWAEPPVLVCQVDDRGFVADPLAGRIPPSATTEGGRGLLLANQLCDLVRIHTRPGGTSIRLHMELVA